MHSVDIPGKTVTHRRIPTLDGWRAVAIIGVLCCHIRWPFPIIERLAVYGGLGVQLFFALSGFLITSRLIEEYHQLGLISWKEFYIRRAFRILPPAFFFLATLAVLGMGLHLIPIAANQIAACVFFYRNYLYAGGWYTGHFWSLAVEEHFYLLWPAILTMVGMARGARTAIILTVAAIMWGIADRHFDWIAHLRPVLHGNDHRTDYCIAQLFEGCVLAFLWQSQSVRGLLEKHLRSYWVAGVLGALLLLLRYQPKWYDTPVEVLIALLPLITVADPKGIVSRFLETGPMVWVGRLSYSLYLWQQLFLPVVWAPQVLGIFQTLPFNIVFTLSAASFSYYFVERPFIRWGRCIVDRRNIRLTSRTLSFSTGV